MKAKNKKPAKAEKPKSTAPLIVFKTEDIPKLTLASFVNREPLASVELEGQQMFRLCLCADCGAISLSLPVIRPYWIRPADTTNKLVCAPCFNKYF